MTTELLDIPWRQVRPMVGQPREFFDKAKLKDLADSIRARGQKVAARVYRLPATDSHGRSYELIDGQRRWHAVQIAGLDTIRAEVVEGTDADERFVDSVVANFCREPHSPMEIARAIDRIHAGRSSEAVGAILGRSEAYVDQHLALLKLHPDLQDLLGPEAPKDARLPFTAGVRLSLLEKHRQLEAYALSRESDLSPLRAVNRIVDDMVAAERPATIGRHFGRVLGPRIVNFGDLADRILRLKATLGSIEAPRLAELAANRGDDEVRDVAKDLEAISAIATALLDAISVKT